MVNAVAVKALLALALVGGGLVGGQWYLGRERATADAAGYARRDAEQKTADNKALKEALADVERLRGVIQGISDDEKRARETADRHAAAAAAAGSSLRAAEARLRAALAARSCPGASAPAGSAPADPAIGVLADVQRRLDEAQDRVAGFADQSRRAGLACERLYDALK